MGELERYGLLALVAVSVLTVGFLMEELRARGGPEQVLALKSEHREGVVLLPEQAAGSPVAAQVERPGGGETRRAGPVSRSRPFDFFEEPAPYPGSTHVQRPPKQAPSGPQGKYTIRSGDSLWSIAQDQLGDANRWQEIASLNGLNKSSILKLNKKLVMPPKDGREG